MFHRLRLFSQREPATVSVAAHGMEVARVREGAVRGAKTLSAQVERKMTRKEGEGIRIVVAAGCMRSVTASSSPKHWVPCAWVRKCILI